MGSISYNQVSLRSRSWIRKWVISLATHRKTGWIFPEWSTKQWVCAPSSKAIRSRSRKEARRWWTQRAAQLPNFSIIKISARAACAGTITTLPFTTSRRTSSVSLSAMHLPLSLFVFQTFADWLLWFGFMYNSSYFTQRVLGGPA